MTALNNNADIKAICSNLVYCGLTSVHPHSDNNTVEISIKSDSDFLRIVKTSWDDDDLIWGDGTVAINKYGCNICLVGESKVVITGIPVKRFCTMLQKEMTKYNNMMATRDEYVHDLVINGLD